MTISWHKATWGILRDALVRYGRENVPRLGAALAYYTLFALAPLLVVAIGVAGMVFGAEAARGQVVTQIDGLIGREGALAVQSLLAKAQEPSRSIPATIIGLITLFLGATSAFSALQGALNEVWNVPGPKVGPIKGFVRGRLLSFGMVLGIGFLLLVSLALSAALAAVGTLVETRLSGGATFWWIVNFLVSFAIITLLFAMIYRVLPDAKLAWKHVWIGGMITSFLFTVGKTLIGLYLGRSSISSSFGAAGSIVVLLIWVYYSSQIVLFGAVITQLLSSRHVTRNVQ